MSLTPSEFVAENKEGCRGCLFAESSQAALWCLDLARQRLQAYLQGDQEQYHAVRVKELYSYASAECLILRYHLVACIEDLEDDEGHAEAYYSGAYDSEMDETDDSEED